MGIFLESINIECERNVIKKYKKNFSREYYISLTVPRKLFKKDIKKLIKIFDTDQKYLIPDETNQRAKY